MRNNIETDFKFDSEDLIEVKTNGDELCFVNESKKKEYKMNVRMGENDWKQACFCVYLCCYSQGSPSSVKIVKWEMIVYGLDTGKFDWKDI